jgi:hypothetical protein
MNAVPAIRPFPPRPLWVAVAPGLTVGSCEGNFLGTIERTSTGFVATDGCGDPVGFFPTRKSAQQALGSRPRGRLSTPRERAERIGFVAATVGGTVAGTLALTAGALAPLL